jgi:hypothetical protein
MRKLLLAALLALPMSLLASEKASAGEHTIGFGGCFCFRMKICTNISFWPCGGCGASCYGGSCAYGGCGGCVPGPWYLYWPYDGSSQVAGGYGCNWTLDQHFVTPAPTGYPYGPNPMVITAGAGCAPGLAGGYPSYWYGR